MGAKSHLKPVLSKGERKRRAVKQPVSVRHAPDEVQKAPKAKGHTPKYKELGYSSYGDYLASDHWVQKRHDYFASDRPQTCFGIHAGQRCDASLVQLHHWTYRRLGSEELTDLVALCDECHERVHKLAGSLSTKKLRQATQAVCGDGPWTKTRKRDKGKAKSKKQTVIVLEGDEPTPGRPSRKKRTFTRQDEGEQQLANAQRQLGVELRFYLKHHQNFHSKGRKSSEMALRRYADRAQQRDELEELLRAAERQRQKSRTRGKHKRAATVGPDATGSLRR